MRENTVPPWKMGGFFFFLWGKFLDFLNRTKITLPEKWMGWKSSPFTQKRSTNTNFTYFWHWKNLQKQKLDFLYHILMWITSFFQVGYVPFVRSGNDASPSVEQLRRIDAVVQRNRERLSLSVVLMSFFLGKWKVGRGEGGKVGGWRFFWLYILRKKVGF